LVSAKFSLIHGDSIWFRTDSLRRLIATATRVLAVFRDGVCICREVRQICVGVAAIRRIFRQSQSECFCSLTVIYRRNLFGILEARSLLCPFFGKKVWKQCLLRVFYKAKDN